MATFAFVSVSVFSSPPLNKSRFSDVTRNGGGCTSSLSRAARGSCCGCPIAQSFRYSESVSRVSMLRFPARAGLSMWPTLGRLRRPGPATVALKSRVRCTLERQSACQNRPRACASASEFRRQAQGRFRALFPLQVFVGT